MISLICDIYKGTEQWTRLDWMMTNPWLLMEKLRLPNREWGIRVEIKKQTNLKWLKNIRGGPGCHGGGEKTPVTISKL